MLQAKCFIFPGQNAKNNKAELLELGRKFGLVTPDCSLVVLTTLQQHLKHRIQPSKARQALWEEYQSHQGKCGEELNARFEIVKQKWSQKVGWWDAQNKKKQMLGEKSPGSGGRVSTG